MFQAVVGGLSTHRSVFDPSSVHVKFVVDKVEPRLRLSPVSTITSVLQTRLHRYVALARSTKGQNVRTFLKRMVFEKSGRAG